MFKFVLGGAVAFGVAFWAVPVLADDWYTGSGDQTLSQNFGASINASLSATSQGDSHFAAIGTIAPFTKVDQTGARFRLDGDVGDYSYKSSIAGIGEVKGTEEDTAFLAGWKWVGNRTSVELFAGPELRSDTLNKYDPGNTGSKTSAGFATNIDVYANPTPYTMAFGQLSYSTVRRAYLAHIKFGIAVAKNVFVGPEALLLGDDLYRQWRVGVHITGVALGPIQLGASAGYLHDATRGAGEYGALDTRLAF